VGLLILPGCAIEPFVRLCHDELSNAAVVTLFSYPWHDCWSELYGIRSVSAGTVRHVTSFLCRALKQELRCTEGVWV